MKKLLRLSATFALAFALVVAIQSAFNKTASAESSAPELEATTLPESAPEPDSVEEAGKETEIVVAEVARAVATPEKMDTPLEAQKSSEASKVVVAKPAPAYPGTLLIPSISLRKQIGSVGLTKSGNMGVLDDPSRVGWYKGGAAPGEVGSAVIGAHVYQAFAGLKDVKVGESVYVEQPDGRKLRFVVEETAVYAYTDPKPLQKIFGRADKARLTLITCFGALTADRSTYTHRFVVYATLAS